MVTGCRLEAGGTQPKTPGTETGRYKSSATHRSARLTACCNLPIFWDLRSGI